METADANEILETWQYRTERVHLSPYSSEAFDELFLPRLYLKTKEEGLLDLIFPGWHSKMTLPDFVDYLNARQQGFVVATLRPDYPVVGYGWLNEIEGVNGARKASFGFCFFREYHRSEEIRDLARLALAYWFKEIDLNVLYGATLFSNRPAIKFSQEMGFHQIGLAPKFFVKGNRMDDAWIVVLEREDFTSVQY